MVIARFLGCSRTEPLVAQPTQDQKHWNGSTRSPGVWFNPGATAKITVTRLEVITPDWSGTNP